MNEKYSVLSTSKNLGSDLNGLGTWQSAKSFKFFEIGCRNFSRKQLREVCMKIEGRYRYPRPSTTSLRP